MKLLQTTMNFRPVKPRALGTVKAMVTELYDQVGGPWPTAALKIGVGKSQAYAFADPLSPEQISFERVAQLTTPESPAGAQFLAALTGGVLCLPPSASPGSPMEMTGKAAKEFGEALAKSAKTIADNIVTRKEYAATEKEIDEAICALFAWKASLKAMAEDGQ